MAQHLRIVGASWSAPWRALGRSALSSATRIREEGWRYRQPSLLATAHGPQVAVLDLRLGGASSPCPGGSASGRGLHRGGYRVAGDSGQGRGLPLREPAGQHVA